MKSKIFFIQAFFVLLGLSSCQSDDADVSQPFVAAFASESYNLAEIPTEKPITLVFSEVATTDGTVTIQVEATNAAYKTDFETVPSAENGTFTLPFTAGQKEITFVYKNNIPLPFDEDDQLKSIRFKIVKIDYGAQSNIQGFTTTQVQFGASLGAVLKPETGGPNQGNQVYIDLSTELMTLSRRDVWDLGFYSGEEFRVVINGSLYMAVKALESTDIDSVTPASVQSLLADVAVGTFDPVNANYIDAPNGMITQTAISEISADPNANKVYLVNMGYEIGNTVPPVGSVAVAGNSRGWKKIRITRNGDGYQMEYADLNSTTHNTLRISKREAYNFNFFSMKTKSIVEVEPEKAKWDLNFTVFTNEIVGSGSYGYSDFVVNNLKAGVKVYRVNSTNPLAFSAFSKANIDDSKFTDDQRIIGADWRDVFTGSAATDRFYILKDVDGNYYKIRMTAFVNEGGVRGYPQFEYKLVQ